VNVHKIIRIAAVFLFAFGVGVGYHRLHRTPEQTALRQLVEDDLPKLRPSETAIYDRLDQLWRSPGLKPDEARRLLVDDVIPRLVRLRKQVEELPLPEAETRALLEEYLQATDQLIAACRTCVRIIDDPKLSTLDGMKQVRERFATVEGAFRTWDRHVTEACARHQLAAPQARP
jgi:hypothetical protein